MTGIAATIAKNRGIDLISSIQIREKTIYFLSYPSNLERPNPLFKFLLQSLHRYIYVSILHIPENHVKENAVIELLEQIAADWSEAISNDSGQSV